MMARDNITRAGASAPWGKATNVACMAVLHRAGGSDSGRRFRAGAENTKDGGKPVSGDGHAGSKLAAA
jgi:hypothetical protein